MAKYKSKQEKEQIRLDKQFPHIVYKEGDDLNIERQTKNMLVENLIKKKQSITMRKLTEAVGLSSVKDTYRLMYKHGIKVTLVRASKEYTPTSYQIKDRHLNFSLYKEKSDG